MCYSNRRDGFRKNLENLILNQTDLTPFKDRLLDQHIDIEDFFD